MEITEYKTLNPTKGVIYSNDLRRISEKEITDELLDQNVCEVKQIYRMVNNELIETGLTIISFASSSLPSDTNKMQ